MYKEKKVEEVEREKEEERKKGSRKREERKILFNPEKSILKFKIFQYYKSIKNIIYELIHYRFVTVLMTL